MRKACVGLAVATAPDMAAGVVYARAGWVEGTTWVWGNGAVTGGVGGEVSGEVSSCKKKLVHDRVPAQICAQLPGGLQVHSCRVVTRLIGVQWKLSQAVAV